MPPGLIVSCGEHFITIKTDISVFDNIINRKAWFLGSASEQHDPEFTMKVMEVDKKKEKEKLQVTKVSKKMKTWKMGRETEKQSRGK